MPVVSENAVPVDAGVKLSGFGVHGLGGLVDPGVQLKVIELLYPFTAIMVPLNVGVVPENAVSGVFETAISKSGVAIKLNCHTPRPEVEARNSFWPPELKSASAVTATLGRNPVLLELGPSSVHAAADVGLWKTPTSVPT